VAQTRFDSIFKTLLLPRRCCCAASSRPSLQNRWQGFSWGLTATRDGTARRSNLLRDQFSENPKFSAVHWPEFTQKHPHSTPHTFVSRLIASSPETQSHKKETENTKPQTDRVLKK